MTENKERPKPKVDRLLGLDFSKEKELQEMLELLAEICLASASIVSLRGQDISSLTFSQGSGPLSPSAALLICGNVMEANRLLVEEACSYPLHPAKGEIAAYAGIPLSTAEGDHWGVLLVYDSRFRFFTAFQQQMLKMLASQISHLLEFEFALKLLKAQYEHSVSSANQLLTYFHSSSSCHLLLDPELRVIAYNKAFAALLQLNHQVTLEEGMSVINYVHPDFLSSFIASFNRAFAGEVVKSQRELKYEHGRIFWDMTYQPAFNSSGEIIGVTFNATDITQRMNDKKRLALQKEAIFHINYIQGHALLGPIERINLQMQELGKYAGLEDVPEVEFLTRTAAELIEKKEIILAVSQNQT